MNRVNLGEDPGYSESKHPILNIHVHAHGWRGKLSLSPHSRDTTNGTTTCTQGKRTVTEGSCREKHETSTREEPGFHWRCRSTFQRWMAVHLCLKKGCDCSSVAGGWWATGEQTQDQLSVCGVDRGLTQTGERKQENPLGYPGPWQLRKDLSPLLEIRHNFSTLISDFGLSLTTLRIFFFDAQIEPSHYT